MNLPLIVAAVIALSAIGLAVYAMISVARSNRIKDAAQDRVIALSAENVNLNALLKSTNVELATKTDAVDRCQRVVKMLEDECNKLEENLANGATIDVSSVRDSLVRALASEDVTAESTSTNVVKLPRKPAS